MKVKKFNIDLVEHRIDVVIKAKKYWPKRDRLEKLAKYIADNWLGSETVMLTEEGDGEYHLTIVMKKVEDSDVPFALDVTAQIKALEQLFSGYLYAI